MSGAETLLPNRPKAEYKKGMAMTTIDLRTRPSQTSAADTDPVESFTNASTQAPHFEISAQLWVLMCIAGFLVVAFRVDGVSRALRGHDGTDLAGDGLSAATVAAMAEGPDLESLFDRTVRAVVDSFVPDAAPTRSRSTSRKQSAR